MHWEIIDKKRYQLLKNIVETITIKEYYMAGGTALALQTGIRESFDFDFFVQREFDENLLIQELEKIGEIQVTTSRTGTLHIILDGVQVTFLQFENNLVASKVAIREMKNLYLADIKDIAIMKLIAISQRGTKKDFFDLFYICNHFAISIKEILAMLDKKYNKNKINYSHIIQSLSYFEDAEDENLPKVFIQYDWNEIKNFYCEEQKRIYHSLETNC